MILRAYGPKGQGFESLMAHHEKGQADCLSFFVVRYPSEVVTRQPVAVDRQFSICFVFMIHKMIDFAIILCKMQTKNH